MTQRFVEGFGTYGQSNSFLSTQGPALNMLAGRWASLSAGVPHYLGQLPWAPTDTDLFLSTYTLGSGAGARVVLPATAATMICSVYWAVNKLSSVTPAQIMHFCDGSNNIIAGIAATTTGAIVAYVSNTIDGFVAFSTSSSPALTAQSAAHIECELTVVSSLQLALSCYVNGVEVLSGVTFTSGSMTGHFSNIAQMRFLDFYPIGVGGDAGQYYYVGNIIIRDTAGSYNNTIMGDRRVATLFVNADDPSHQGWTGEPLQRFGTGILDNTVTPQYSGVSTGASASTDIGASQFTIEGNFRLQAGPFSTGKAVMFGKWDAANSNMSYELYIGGSSVDGGNTVFRITTDGTSGTIIELISWPYQWQIGIWYHVAVARDGSNNLRLFINGVLQGLAVVDSHTYYAAGAAGAVASLGAEYSATGGNVYNTAFQGWQDEFRLTIGVCRYTAAFTPPSAAFPRGSGDAYWSYVAWISGWDAGIIDESSYARTLVSHYGAAAITPNDGAFNYQTLNKPTPSENTFIQASLIAAADILTYTTAPTANAVIRVGTKDGTNAANYTWKASLTGASFEVLIGASIAASMANLAAAINAGAGAGTVYGTGTTANHDVSANVLVSNQLQAVALTAGTGGNSIVATSTDANGTWATGTLTGGASIPAYSQFNVQRLPSNTTIVDSVTILSRSWKTDAGACQVQASWVGTGGGVETGGNNSITTAPNFYSDTFETDPDTSSGITPTTVLLAKVRMNRTV